MKIITAKEAEKLGLKLRPYEVLVYGFQCQKCQRTWVPEDLDRPPRHCADKNCNSPNWMRERTKNGRLLK